MCPLEKVENPTKLVTINSLIIGHFMFGKQNDTQNHTQITNQLKRQHRNVKWLKLLTGGWNSSKSGLKLSFSPTHLSLSRSSIHRVRAESARLASPSGFGVGWVLRNAAVNFLCESCHNKETSLSAQELRTAGRFRASSEPSALEVTWQLTSEPALWFFVSEEANSGKK